MDLSILPNSGVPAYRQIASQIASQILSGVLPAGFALPPIRSVSKELGVSVITVRTAWEQLEADGLIETRAGSGCYVASLKSTARHTKRDDALARPLSELISRARELGFSKKDLQSKIDELWQDKKP